jgi:hypothetical protein
MQIGDLQKFSLLVRENAIANDSIAQIQFWLYLLRLPITGRVKTAYQKEWL